MRFLIYSIGIRKHSLERQDSSVLYDECYADHEANEYEASLYPSSRNSHEPTTASTTKLVNRYDYSYGLDRQWNTNSSVNLNSHLPSKGKLLPKVPLKSYNVMNDHRETTTSLLSESIPIASGSTKKTRQLPQPIVSAAAIRKRLPKAGISGGYTRQLPQMPSGSVSSIIKSKYPASLMSRSDTEYTKFGITEEFERRGAMSAMQYKDYSYSPSLRTYEPYDDTAKSMNEPSIFHSNDSLNTTAQSLFSEYSSATERRNKFTALSSAIPVASSYTNNLNQVTDSYQNYTSSTSTSKEFTFPICFGLHNIFHTNSFFISVGRKRLPKIPPVPISADANSTSISNFEPTPRSTGKRLPTINALPKPYLTSSSCKCNSLRSLDQDPCNKLFCLL